MTKPTSESKGKWVVRSKKWEIWDAFQKDLNPLQRRYARSAVRLAKKRFGASGVKPPTRMGVQMWIESVYFAVAMEILDWESENLPRKGKRQ